MPPSACARRTHTPRSWCEPITRRVWRRVRGLAECVIAYRGHAVLACRGRLIHRMHGCPSAGLRTLSRPCTLPRALTAVLGRFWRWGRRDETEHQPHCTLNRALPKHWLAIRPHDRDALILRTALGFLRCDGFPTKLADDRP
jgi:hypothetical protein